MDGVPKVGVLLEDAWNMSAICRFRIRTASALVIEREKKAALVAAAVAALNASSTTAATNVPSPSAACGVAECQEKSGELRNRVSCKKADGASQILSLTRRYSKCCCVHSSLLFRYKW